MNIKKILFAAAVIAVVSCTSNNGKKGTRISGNFALASAPEQVHISISQAGVDTLVAVNPKDGSFTLNTVVNPKVYGTVESTTGNVRFIPDGTEIKIDFTGDSPVVTFSDTLGLNSLAEKYHKQNEKIIEEYRDIADDDSLSEDDKRSKLEAKYDEYVAYNKDFVKENAGNAAGVEAFKAVQDEYTDSEIKDILSSFGDDVISVDKRLTALQKSIDARANTAEGAKFTDFTVDQGDGTKASLSDYVGKGKYVLVDFWASWCGPCRAEIPNIKNVYNKYKGKDFDVLSVAVWDKVDDTKKAAKELGVTWNQIVNGQRVPTDIYGIDGIPHIIFFSPDGTILKRGLRGDDIEATVSQYVKK